MRRETAMILVLGCLVILALEAPAALSSVAQAMHGPYPDPAVRERTAEAPISAPPMSLALPEGLASLAEN